MLLERDEITIENEHWKVDLDPMGASISRLFPVVVGRSILRDSPRPLDTGRNSGAYPVPTLFGRHEGSRVFIAGREFLIPAQREFALHGLEVDFLYEVVQRAPTAVTFRQCLHDLVPGYPFLSQVAVTYSLLAETLRVVIGVKNLGTDFPVPAMAVWHPFFQRYLDSCGGLDTHIRLEAQVGNILRFDGAQPMPTKPMQPALPHEKFSTSRLFTNPYDNSLTWNGNATIRWPGQLELRMTSNARWLHLFTGRERSVCIEPALGPTNGLWLRKEFNEPHYQSLVEPGDEAFLQTELQIVQYR